MANATTNATLNPPNTTQLPCGCVVTSISGQLVTCPNGHDQDRPNHRRPWC